MRRRNWYFVMAIMQTMSWCCVTSWHFALHDVAPPRHGQIPQFQQIDFSPNQVDYGREKSYRGLSRLGSRPPNCEHKCEGCIPCNAIQIPANTDRKRVEYANYEPEGWKCKCGTTFFNP